MLLDDQVVLVRNTMAAFPRVARGHGTKSWGCSAQGCNGLEAKHFQNRFDLAIEHLVIERKLPINVKAVKWALAVS